MTFNGIANRDLLDVLSMKQNISYLNVELAMVGFVQLDEVQRFFQLLHLQRVTIFYQSLHTEA
jgi:hypothetical protein